jgi:chemotaxis protein methyltransferase CheR
MISGLGATARPGTLPGGPQGVPALRPGEFARFQDLVFREVGIWLSEAKQALLVGRLGRRVRELGCRSFGDYYQRVLEDDGERVLMVDAICTNETHFFREPRQFEFLENSLLPGWTAAAAAGRRAHRVRVWSAACSSGEEPYSIAMLLLHALPPSWEVEVLGSDVSTKVLERARAAVWRIEKAQEVPMAHLKRFMLRGVGPEAGHMKAGSELRQAVQFRSLNLNDPSYAVGAPFDAIFCRNVLIYFRPETKRAVISRLLQHLAPGGCLFLGHAESLSSLDAPVRSVGPNVYAALSGGRPA